MDVEAEAKRGDRFPKSHRDPCLMTMPNQPWKPISLKVLFRNTVQGAGPGCLRRPVTPFLSYISPSLTLVPAHESLKSWIWKSSKGYKFPSFATETDKV